MVAEWIGRKGGMMYFVECLNEHGDWIRTSKHKNLDNARINAEVRVNAYTKARIIHEGKVIEVIDDKDE